MLLLVSREVIFVDRKTVGCDDLSSPDCRHVDVDQVHLYITQIYYINAITTKFNTERLHYYYEIYHKNAFLLPRDLQHKCLTITSETVGCDDLSSPDCRHADVDQVPLRKRLFISRID